MNSRMSILLKKYNPSTNFKSRTIFVKDSIKVINNLLYTDEIFCKGVFNQTAVEV